jgi:hypothetical protein
MTLGRHGAATRVLALITLLGAGRSWAQARSPQFVRVLQQDTPVWLTANRDGARRGALQLGAIVPVLERSPSAAGCPEPWLRVALDAWLCGNDSGPAALATSATAPTLAAVAGLPYRYYFVAENGSFGYSTLSLTDEGIPDSQLEPGFAVAIAEVHQKADGESFGRTSHGLWLPLRDLRPANPSTFHGQPLPSEVADVGWVFETGVRVHDKPAGTPQGSSLERLTFVTIEGEQKRGGVLWLDLGDKRWLRARSVRRWRRAPAPAALKPAEHWLDIDLERQILTAYEAERPIFATLVSTGRGLGDSPEATPMGEHRVWVKLVSQDMTNLEDVTQSSVYAIEEVPWVMFFKQGYGLHAAFWHNAFGTRRSHGCVNLSPLDAETVFRFITPDLPTGFRAILPGPTDPGSRVIVH